MQASPKSYGFYIFLLGLALVFMAQVVSMVNQQAISTVPYLVYWIKTIAIWSITLILVVLFPFRFHTKFSWVLFFVLTGVAKHLFLFGLGSTYGYHLTVLDCCNLALVVLLLEKKGVPQRWALLYLLNPLITFCLFKDDGSIFFITKTIGLLVFFLITRCKSKWGWGLLFSLIVGMGFLGGVYDSLLLTALLCLLFVVVHPGFWGLLVVSPLLLLLGPTFVPNTVVFPPEVVLVQLLYVLSFTAVFLLAAHYCRAFYFRAKRPCNTITVVIPTCNEQDRIQACIARVMQCDLVEEVLVVDGGSVDSTVLKAQQAGGKVILHKTPFTDGGGRGGQIGAGIIAARGDVMTVIHADTLVSPASLQMIIDVLQRDPLILGGSLGCSFRSSKKNDGNC